MPNGLLNSFHLHAVYVSPKMNRLMRFRLREKHATLDLTLSFENVLSRLRNLYIPAPIA